MELWRRNQVAVTAASFVGFTGFTMVMPFLASYIQDLGVTDLGDVAVWTGLTLGVTPALSALCAPLWGRVADRFGNKLLLLRALASCVVWSWDSWRKRRNRGICLRCVRFRDSPLDTAR